MTGNPTARAERLAGVVAERVPGLAPAWRAAIASVPRHVFVPDRIWLSTGPVDKSDDADAWWDATYDDIPIVTAVDGGPGREEWPTSSASQPSVVAAMLGQLDVTTAGPYLEIGAGTGWNASLLRAATGREVVSVEINPAVAEAARRACERAGTSPRIITGDGTVGQPDRAPFAAVIATCSVYSVPMAWVEQTRPGGVLLVPWASPWVPFGIARLIRDDRGGASGPFSALGSFMPLRSSEAGYDGTPPSVDEDAPAHERETLLPPWKVRPEEPEAAFMVSATLPGYRFRVAEAHRPEPGTWCCTMRVIDPTGANWADVDHDQDQDDGPFTVTVHGERDVWADIEHAYAWWEAEGNPGPERFGLSIDPDGSQRVWYERPTGRTWPLAPRKP